MRKTRRQWYAYKLIEEELRNYKQTVKDLEGLKLDIIFSSPEPCEVKVQTSNLYSPTESAALEIVSSSTISYLSRVVQAIEIEYECASEIDKRLIELLYWQGKSRVYVIDTLFQGATSTFRRHKLGIIIKIGNRIGLKVS